VVSGALPPQATRPRTITQASSIAMSFFIVFPPKKFGFFIAITVCFAVKAREM
jgi:hypothetical protein